MATCFISLKKGPHESAAGSGTFVKRLFIAIVDLWERLPSRDLLLFLNPSRLESRSHDESVCIEDLPYSI
jgi:hypothetical protein